LGTAAAAVYSIGFEAADGADATRFFPALYYPLFALYGAAAWWVWRHKRASVPLVIAFAMLFRLLAVADPPSLSSDVHRYPWDGLVQRAGHSPYAHPPGDATLAPLRDAAIHPHINRQWARTVYPPGAQALFLVLPYDIDGTRLVMIAFDLVTMLLLVVLLGRLGLDPARVILYAWAPLVVYEVANNGHLEAAVIPFMVGAMLAWRAGLVRRTGLLIGVAAAMKLYPALLCAAFDRRRLVRLGLVAGAVVGVGYLIYGAFAGRYVLGFLPEYVGVAEDHNIGLRALIEWPLAGVVSHPRAVAFALCAAGLLAGVWTIARSDGPPERKALHVAALYLVLLPTAFHPWYALWLIPWLCIRPSLAWLWLTAALPLSYLKYSAVGGVMPGWVVPLEWLPVVALLLFERWRSAAPVQEVEAC